MTSSYTYRIFVTQPIPDQSLKLMNSLPNIKCVINEQLPLTRDHFMEQIKDCHGLFCTLNEKVDKELIEHAGSNLKVIATCSVGYEHIDLNECKKRNIRVGYTPGVLTDATAEFTIGLLLNTSRRISEAIEAAKNGKWGQWNIMWMVGKGVHGSTVGIFGLGRIGLAVAKRLIHFNPSRIIYNNRSINEQAQQLGINRVEMDELLAESDFLICICASNSETIGIFNLKLFKKMKPTAIFINVSRGNVVNQDDLCEALKSGHLAAAGLDVTTPEPLPTNHELFRLPNCFISPHICSAEMSTRLKMANITAMNIVNALSSSNNQLIHELSL